jgi:hypothetical protein
VTIKVNNPLTTRHVYTFEGLREPHTYFCALPLILGIEHSIVIGLRDPLDSVHHFLEKHSLALDDYVAALREYLAICDDGYPHTANAYRISADAGLLSQLAGCFGEGEITSGGLHVVGFREQKPWFEFTDAFRGGTMDITSLTSLAQIESFATKLGMNYHRRGNPYLKWGLEPED